MTTLIPRNTTIPTRKSEILFHGAPTTDEREVHVLRASGRSLATIGTLGRFT